MILIIMIEKNTKNGIAINHIIKTETKASKQQLLETAAVLHFYR